MIVREEEGEGEENIITTLLAPDGQPPCTSQIFDFHNTHFQISVNTYCIKQ
jgi:hypothetical protein